MVESAPIYFVTLICVISTFATKSNANVFLDVVSFFLRFLPDSGLVSLLTV